MAYKNCMKCRVSLTHQKNFFKVGFDKNGLCSPCGGRVSQPTTGKGEVIAEIAEAMRVPTLPNFPEKVWNGKEIQF